MPIDKNRLKDLFSHGHAISFDQFCRVMQDFSPSAPDAYFQETFRAFDKNADGFITAKEIKQTMKDLGERLTTKQAKDMLKTADCNGDGKLSQDEFRVLFNQLNRFTASPPVSPTTSTNEHTSQAFHLF
jgi:Ca2+-binding EF-hand superfamily protein